MAVSGGGCRLKRRLGFAPQPSGGAGAFLQGMWSWIKYFFLPRPKKRDSLTRFGSLCRISSVEPLDDITTLQSNNRLVSNNQLKILTEVYQWLSYVCFPQDLKGLG